MRAAKWIFWVLILAVMGTFLHYVLPKRAVVYVTSTENRIVSPDEVRGFRSLSEATVDAQGRTVTDVFFINTTRRDGGVLVFRNEDTGVGFPPYFKFDSANVQAEAQDAVSTRDAPRWVVMRYYGWRWPFLSMFPNATSMRLATDPDVRLVPWFNIVFITLLVAAVWAIWARLARLFRRRTDPVAASWDPATVQPARGWRFWRR